MLSDMRDGDENFSLKDLVARVGVMERVFESFMRRASCFFRTVFYAEEEICDFSHHCLLKTFFRNPTLTSSSERRRIYPKS